MFNNRRWQAKARIPPTETRITQAYFIAEDIQRELAAVIEKAARASDGHISDMLASWDTAAREGVPRGLSPVLHMMLSIANPAELSARIGWMNRHGIGAPISVSVQGDPRRRERCRIFIDEGPTNIGIPEYWLWRDHATVRRRRAYTAYVAALARAVGIPGLAAGADAEREYAQIYPNIPRHEKPLNMLSWAELRREFAGIDWSALLVNYGLTDAELPHLLYNVGSPTFLHHLNRRFTTWPIGRWQSWLGLIVTQWVAGRSPPGPLRAAWFDYTRQFSQGMETDDPATELRNGIILYTMPNTVGRLWVRDHCEPGLRRRIMSMVERIRGAAIDRLGRVSWMAPSTRAAAVTKLRHMDIQVCWPDPWKTSDYPKSLSRTDFIDNMMTLTSYAVDNSLAVLRSGDCDGRRHHGAAGTPWDKPVYEVNAYYYPSENRFVLPAAILRSPFYDSAASLPWNYGAIGATIGHELCHAFDAEGRTYDDKGNKHDWWSPRDDREYRRRTRKVVELYESQRYRGMEVNGTLTLVENIADLGGIEFALAGAAAALGRALKVAELREFFTAFAITWRAKDRRKRAAQLLEIDPHSPPYFRVNHVVRQFDEWYEAFGVGEDCPGYIPPDKRIRFFR